MDENEYKELVIDTVRFGNYREKEKLIDLLNISNFRFEKTNEYTKVMNQFKEYIHICTCY